MKEGIIVAEGKREGKTKGRPKEDQRQGKAREEIRQKSSIVKEECCSLKKWQKVVRKIESSCH